MNISRNTIYRVNLFISKIPEPNFYKLKLVGPTRIVQVDKTMLDYKCNSHRGRSLENWTAALYIIEFVR